MPNYSNYGHDQDKPEPPRGSVARYTRNGWQIVTNDELATLRAEANAQFVANAAAYWDAWLASHYPTGWPTKLRPAMDALRHLTATDPAMRWTWYRKQGDGDDRPKGCIAFDFDDERAPLVFATPAQLATHLLGAPAKPTAKPSRAQVVDIALRLLEVARAHDAELASEAERLLSVA